MDVQNDAGHAAPAGTRALSLRAPRGVDPFRLPRSPSRKGPSPCRGGCGNWKGGKSGSLNAPFDHEHSASPTPHLDSCSPGPSSVSTQAPSCVSTQAPSCVSTQAPSSASTQAPSCVSMQAPSSVSTQAPSCVSTQAPSSASTQAPSCVSTQAPSASSLAPSMGSSFEPPKVVCDRPSEQVPRGLP
jgi:hypothetical protein